MARDHARYQNAKHLELGDNSYDIAPGGNAVFNAETFFAGTAEANYSSTFDKGTAGSISQSFFPNVGWTPCGAATILRLNSSILLKGGNSNARDS